MTLKAPHETHIRTADDLTAFWRDVVGIGGFAQRSLWLIFLAADGELMPAIVPIDDLAAEPDDRFVGNLATIVGGLPEDKVSSVALMLSRPGPIDMMDSDRRWAAALHRALGPESSRWPIHLGTRNHVQVFRPDDLIGA